MSGHLLIHTHTPQPCKGGRYELKRGDDDLRNSATTRPPSNQDRVRVTFEPLIHPSRPVIIEWHTLERHLVYSQSLLSLSPLYVVAWLGSPGVSTGSDVVGAKFALNEINKGLYGEQQTITPKTKPPSTRVDILE